VDEKVLKDLEVKLNDLGKTIDAKLSENAETYKKASSEAKEGIKKEIEPMLKQYGELNEKFQKMQGQLDTLDTQLQRADFNGEEKKATFTEAIKSEFIKFGEKGGLRENLRSKRRTGEIMLKVDDMLQSNSFESTAVVRADKVPGIVFNPDRRERVRDLISAGTTSSNAVTYVYEHAYDDKTDVTTEGAEYKQGDFDLKLATATVRKITAYIMLSEEMLDDVEGLTSYIASRLPSKLKVKEDYQLLYGSGAGINLSGITTNATAYVDNLADDDISRVDVLVDACRQIRDDEYQATAILIHPTDATLIKLTKDDNGNYIHPWIFMPGGQITLDGVPVIVSTAITAGDFLVGDFRLGAQVFDRKQASLEMSYENEDNFIKGMVTVRIAERLTLAVYRSKAFVYGTFTAALANGSA
jgi:HK97 family phage major capsid protein